MTSNKKIEMKKEGLFVVSPKTVFVFRGSYCVCNRIGFV